MPRWKKEEIKLLRELVEGEYGPARRCEIVRLFPRHSLRAVQQKMFSKHFVIPYKKTSLKLPKQPINKNRFNLNRVVEMQNKVFL